MRPHPSLSLVSYGWCSSCWPSLFYRHNELVVHKLYSSQDFQTCNCYRILFSVLTKRKCNVLKSSSTFRTFVYSSGLTHTTLELKLPQSRFGQHQSDIGHHRNPQISSADHRRNASVFQMPHHH